MKTIKVDFCMNRGHEMIIDCEGGIKRTELDELELQMLRSHSAVHLLPIDWMEKDGFCSFRYALSDVTMLSHRLQREPMSMQDYYVLVLGLVDALTECEEYMLRFEGCLLLDQFIFVGANWQDIRLAYVPIAGDSAVSRHTDLLSTVVRWTSYVDQIDGNGLKRILHLMNLSYWPVEELRSTLLDLLDTKTQEVRKQSESVTAASTRPSSLTFKDEDKAVVEQNTYQNEELSNEDEQNEWINYAEIVVEKEEDKEAEQDEGKRKNDKKQLRIMLIMTVLVSALIWRFVYMNDPTEQKMLISGAMTLLLLGVVAYINKRSSKVLLEDQEHLINEFELHSGPLNDKRWNLDDDENINQSQVRPLEDENVQEASYSQEEDKEQYTWQTKESVDNKFSSLVIEPTVLLAKESGDTTLSWLMRMWKGREERVELIQPSFRIGRTGGPASYLEDADGISRLHIEFERSTDGYCAKDLGSRNGSMLNGQQMVPYKQYKLNYGDQIQLAGKQGPIYELKTG